MLLERITVAFGPNAGDTQANLRQQDSRSTVFFVNVQMPFSIGIDDGSYSRIEVCVCHLKLQPVVISATVLQSIMII